MRYNPTLVTTLFYGYSITNTLCTHCHTRVSTLSAFNTLYISLPLTQTRLNVNLVYQFMDFTTGHVSLRTEPIHVKVGPSASLGDVKQAILASLDGELDVVLLIGTYNLVSQSIVSYQLADASQSTDSLQSDGVQNYFILAYPVRFEERFDAVDACSPRYAQHSHAERGHLHRRPSQLRRGAFCFPVSKPIHTATAQSTRPLLSRNPRGKPVSRPRYHAQRLLQRLSRGVQSFHGFHDFHGFHGFHGKGVSRFERVHGVQCAFRYHGFHGFHGFY